MGFYTYTVSIGLAGNAQVMEETTSHIIDSVKSDSILSRHGRLEVSGTLKERDLIEAGETMRGVLNRIVIILRGDGFEVTSEGWNIEQAEEPDGEE